VHMVCCCPGTKLSPHQVFVSGICTVPASNMYPERICALKWRYVHDGAAEKSHCGRPQTDNRPPVRCRTEAEGAYERVQVPAEGDHGSWRVFCFGDEGAGSPPQQPTMPVLMAIDQVLVLRQAFKA